jgi:hypoxanthine phosphoribosyltransferase
MRKIKILDKEFQISIPYATIKQAVEQVATQINDDFASEEVFFICILNGSFMFAADLMKRIKIPNQISFVKISSYEGETSTGVTKKLIGLNEDINGRHVIIIEDIIETGLTLDHIVKDLKLAKPASLKIATLLFKPQAYHHNFKVDYFGLEIPNDFIVGYGLDYNGYGRNYEDIYSVIKS